MFTSADVQKYLQENCNIICSLKIIKNDLILQKEMLKKSNIVDF